MHTTFGSILVPGEYKNCVHRTNMIIKDCEVLYVELYVNNKGHLMPPKNVLCGPA